MPLIGSLLDIFLIFSGLAGWASAVMMWRRQRDQARDHADLRASVDRGVALAAQAMLDTGGKAIDNPSALSFERKRRAYLELVGCVCHLHTNLPCPAHAEG